MDTRMTVGVLVLFAIFVAFPVALFFGLRWLARRWLRHHPSAEATAQLTPTGYALYGCFVLVLLVFAAAHELESTGPLGAFLHRPGGALTALLLAIFAQGIAAEVLRRSGYPTTRVKGARDV